MPEEERRLYLRSSVFAKPHKGPIFYDPKNHETRRDPSPSQIRKMCEAISASHPPEVAEPWFPPVIAERDIG